MTPVDESVLRRPWQLGARSRLWFDRALATAL
ncbi:MAG: hypothetical protein AVDCRST_MAG06-85, partial [uncultured Nocardioides sp.]